MVQKFKNKVLIKIEFLDKIQVFTPVCISTEIEKTANAFGSSMREIVFPGVSREVMFHSFDEDKRWTLGGLWKLFFILFFSFLFFAEFGKSPAGCDVIFIPLPAETPESWPERPIFISSKDVHYALITSPRGWTFKTDTWIPKNSSILRELKILLSSKTQFWALLLYSKSYFWRFFVYRKYLSR